MKDESNYERAQRLTRRVMADYPVGTTISYKTSPDSPPAWRTGEVIAQDWDTPLSLPLRVRDVENPSGYTDAWKEFSELRPADSQRSLVVSVDKLDKSETSNEAKRREANLDFDIGDIVYTREGDRGVVIGVDAPDASSLPYYIKSLNGSATHWYSANNVMSETAYQEARLTAAAGTPQPPTDTPHLAASLPGLGDRGVKLDEAFANVRIDIAQQRDAVVEGTITAVDLAARLCTLNHMIDTRMSAVRLLLAEAFEAGQALGKPATARHVAGGRCSDCFGPITFDAEAGTWTHTAGGATHDVPAVILTD